jgi:Spy/CpxP family protein refolding chaperone
MKRFFQLFTVGVLLGSTLSFTMVSAKEKKGEPKQYNSYMMSSKTIAEQRTNMLASKVNLSADQKAKVYEIELNLAEEQENINSIYKRNGNRETMKASTIEAIKNHDAEIQKVLTPEQKSQLAGTSTEG